MSEEKNQLTTAFVELDERQVSQLISTALTAGAPPASIIEDMRSGMIEIGKRFAGGHYFLTELIMAADIFARAMSQIEPHLGGASASRAGDIVFATVQGDMHDIGKNIVVALLRAADFRVYDLGVDVSPDRIVKKLEESGAHLLGLSALLTTSFISMKETVEALKQAGIRDEVRVMIGGGPVDERVLRYVGADAFGRNPQDAIVIARQLMGLEV
ncbi:MAG: cobalamin-dependent protein [Anaerolineae bacterium]